MFLFVTFIVLGLIALIIFGCSWLAPVDSGGDPIRRWVRITSSVVGGLAAICLVFASFTTVSTKNVAVLTTFGKPSGYLENGFHLKLPWEVPHEISDAVQTDTYASDPDHQDAKQGGATSNCVHVRIERQAIACVNVSIRWQIRPDGVDFLYRNYKSNDHITDNVVLRDLQQAMNEAFVDYDPLGVDANGNNTNLPLTSYAKQVTEQMRAEIGEWIDVQSVIIPLLSYDAGTQDKVQRLLQQIALTRVAVQAEQTAKAQAAANRALAESVSNDPNVLVSRCLDIMKEAVDKGLDLTGWPGCFNVAGADVSVPVR